MAEGKVPGTLHFKAPHVLVRGAISITVQHHDRSSCDEKD